MRTTWTCVQLNVSDGRTVTHKHRKRAGRQHRSRTFWVRPGRTRIWREGGRRSMAKESVFSFVFEVLYSIHTFSRSSTSSSVQIKQSDLLLSFFVFCLCCSIASNKAKYLHSKKTKNLTFST